MAEENQLNAITPVATGSESGEAEDGLWKLEPLNVVAIPVRGLKAVDGIVEEAGDARLSGESSSVHVNLQTEGLAFQVKTQMPISNQVIELSARLNVICEQLAQTQQQLGSAMQRIGFLEAQVLQRDQIIEVLRDRKESHEPG